MVRRPVVLLFLSFLICSAQTVTTFAGNGTAGFSGDNGPAAQAQINRVVSLAADTAGNIYMADQNNNRIRKVDTNGNITTFAGNGVAGFGGDSGQASLAQLNGPLGVCLDKSGNLYVNDEGNYRVRKISTSGVITTVAGNGTQSSSGDGGPATSATMNIPIRCAVDNSGNLYIVDQGAHKIRMVNSSGIISTFAGTGIPGFTGDGGPAAAAEMNNPTAAAFDAAGNLYVSDQVNQRIRRIDTNGIIATVAGNGSAGFSGDGGLATSASLNYPGSTVIDSTGSLYIVDSANNRIRTVLGGIITTVAGTGAAAYSGDNGPASAAAFSNPFGMTADGAGNLYIGDIANNRVRKISGLAAGAGPAITSAGVTNAASFQTGIAPGGIVTIFGNNLGATPGQIITATGNTWAPSLSGVTVTMAGTAVPVYRILNLNGQEQLSVLAPYSLAGQNSVPVVVTTAAAASASVTVPVLGAQPGIFLLDSANSGATHLDGSLAGASNPAKAGENIVLYATGLGPVSNPPAAGQTASLTTLSPALLMPQVTIGGFSAPVSFAGLTPGFIGLYQINTMVPSAGLSGIVQITVQSNNVTSNTATLAVH